MPTRRNGFSRHSRRCSIATTGRANVRELENLLARAAIYLDNDVARHAQTLHEVFPELLRVSTEKPPPEQQAAEASATAAPVTYTVALAALEAAGGNRAAASRALGISRTTFWRLMRSVDQNQTR